MAKSTKKKFLSFLNLLILFVLFCCLSGCGNKGDEITPTTGTGQQIALSGSPTSLAAGQTSILTVKVTNSAGAAVSGRTVAFDFVTNNSTGTVVALNGGTTDAGGQALALYTSGATNPTEDVQDTVQANVTGATGIVIITRMSTSTASTGYHISISALPSVLEAGATSIITATVTDGSLLFASGQAVTFSLLSNNSGATLTALGLGITDTNGQAIATYTAGANSPTINVQDMIQASVTGSTGAVLITRTGTASTATPTTGYKMTLTATPDSLVAGALSVIVAQVNNANGTAAPGLAVTFGFVTNNSGAPALIVVNGTTDASGTATATYTAGNSSPSLSIQDVVSATVTGSAGAAIITRLPAVGTGNRIKSFTQDPETTSTNPIVPPYHQVVMKVKVTTNDNTTPVVGKVVTFSIIAGSGTISAATATTDDNGEAYVLFTRPEVGYGATVIRAQIEGTTYGGDATSIVYWQGLMPTLKLTATSTSLNPGEQSTLTATVEDGFGHAIVGATVNFAFANNNSGAPALNVVNGTTDSSGRAVAVYQAGSTVPTVDSVGASTSYLGYSSADAVSITVTAPTP
jgi:hypothetical protein